jgi:hypothetical protein
VNTNGVSTTTCPRHPQGGPTCWHNAPDHERIRAHKAIMLSGGNLNICHALARGEHVPVDQLDPVWVKRYGIRP